MYQWPADKISKEEMAILHSWRQKTGTPINYLLRQVVVEMEKIIKGRREIKPA